MSGPAGGGDYCQDYRFGTLSEVEGGPMQVQPVGKTRVTILEDHALMRQSLSEVLAQAGFEVVGQYEDPEAFMAAVTADAPGVAIVDLVLQSRAGGLARDGLTLLRELRARHPELFVLIFSGSADAATIERCYRDGASGFLDKLVTERDAVVNAVKAVARGERLFPLRIVPSGLTAAPPEPVPPLLGSLSVREREVLTYVAAGADNLKIATLLQISERTVKAHVTSLYRKLRVENRTQIALAALSLGVRPAHDA
jgi:two-component system nitrate/nitrite response regulator NarL